MDTFWQDVRYTFRSLFRSPGFTVAAVLTLALGIGVNSAIFAIVNGVLLRPLPVEDPDRVTMLYGRNLERDLEETQISGPDFIDWREESESFENLALVRLKTFNLVVGDQPERVIGAFVSHGFFDVLGARPAFGRTFRPEEDLPGQNEAVILSHGAWQRHFGGGSDVLGAAVPLEGEVLTVAGVMPPDFQIAKTIWGDEVDLWIPLGLDSTWNRDWRWLNAMGRLAPGVTVTEAQTEMDAINRRLAQAHPETNEGWSVELRPLHEEVVGDVRQSLFIVLGTVAFVLLIACVNVANLLLARATSRSREMAVRTAIGARRGRLIGQMMLEGLILAGMGAVAGLLLARWITGLLHSIQPQDVPRIDEIGIDLTVIGFTAAVALVLSLVFGLLPAIQSRKIDLTDSLKEGARGSGGVESRAMRNALVVAQIALALVLVTGAGLMVRSLEHLQEVGTGFDERGVITLTTIPRYEYQDTERATAYLREALANVRALPGVESAAMTNFLPFSGRDAQNYLTIDGRTEADDERPRVHLRSISPGYFETLEIPLVAGRGLEERDLEQRRAAVVNETAARLFWPDGDALGSRVKFMDDQPWLTVEGVVGDIRHTRPTEEPVPEIYVPYSMDTYSSTRTFVVRSGLEADRMYPAVRAALQEANPRLPFFDVETLEHFVLASVSRERFLMAALSILAAVAMVLAAVGVYGLLTYSISRQGREIGVRKALGASRGDVYGLVLRNVLRLVLVGVALGLLGAWYTTRLMESVLFEVDARDPLAFGAGAIVLVLIAVITAMAAARKADRVEPLEALHYE